MLRAALLTAQPLLRRESLAAASSALLGFSATSSTGAFCLSSGGTIVFWLSRCTAGDIRARDSQGTVLSGSSNPYPPPDASRGATADLCDVHLPDPVDIVCQRKIQIAEPIFRYAWLG